MKIALANLTPENIQSDYNSMVGNTGLTGFNTVGSVVSKAVPLILSLAGIALLVFLLISGLQLMTSAGDPKKIENARGKITGGLIGFFIVFAAYMIVQILADVLHLPSMRNLLP